jgi:hypothetical protein
MLPRRDRQPGGDDLLQPLRPRRGGHWMHRVIAGIALLEPGYRRILFRPQPGGGLLTSASARHETPYATASMAKRRRPIHGRGRGAYRRYCTRATARTGASRGRVWKVRQHRSPRVIGRCWQQPEAQGCYGVTRGSFQ